MCIAAYLAIGGGLGVSLSTAAHLRTALLWLCWSVLALLAARMVARFTGRRRARATAALRIGRQTRRSPSRAAVA
jgi:cytochrome c-type biogenesis protein CcmH/NrfF